MKPEIKFKEKLPLVFIPELKSFNLVLNDKELNTLLKLPIHQFKTPSLLPLTFAFTRSKETGKSYQDCVQKLVINDIDEKVLQDIKQHPIDYWKQITTSQQIKNIINNVLTFLSSGYDETFIHAEKYNSLLVELRSLTAKLNEDDSQYLKLIIHHLDFILEEQVFDESDIQYLIGSMIVLDYLQSIDFNYFIKGNEIQEIIHYIDRKSDFNAKFLHSIDINRINHIDTAIEKHLNVLIKECIKELRQKYPDIMQVHELETDINISIKNSQFIQDFFQFLDKINIFAKVIKFNLWESIYNQIKNQSEPQSLEFYLSSLLVLPHIFTRNQTIINNYIKKWNFIMPEMIQEDVNQEPFEKDEEFNISQNETTFMEDVVSNQVNKQFVDLFLRQDKGLPHEILDKLDEGKDLNIVEFQSMNLLLKSVVEDTDLQKMYIYFHTLKGDFGVLRMTLVHELCHLAAYLVKSIQEQERLPNNEEKSFLMMVIQSVLELMVKLYYTYIRQSNNFIYFNNEVLTVPMRYILDPIRAHRYLDEIHDEEIHSSPLFMKYLDELEIDNNVDEFHNDLDDIDSNFNDEIHKESMDNVEIPESIAEHIISHENNIDNQTTIDGKIYKQPIIVELKPEHYIVNGVFTALNDQSAYIVNNHTRISLHHWIEFCNVVHDEQQNIMDFLVDMNGKYLGIYDIENGWTYNVNNFNRSLYILLDICIKSGLNKSAYLVQALIDLVMEYQNATPYNFETENNEIFNNHLINENYNHPVMMIENRLINLSGQTLDYLTKLFEHNPLDGLNQENTDILINQIKSYTNKCRHSILLKHQHFYLSSMESSISQLSKIIAKSMTEITEKVSETNENHNTLLLAAQQQESIVTELIQKVDERSLHQTTVLDNAASNINLIHNGLNDFDKKINAIGNICTTLLKGLKKSRLGSLVFRE